MNFILTTDVILMDAQRIHKFSGNGNYALSSFLREVETVISYLQSDAKATQYVQQKIVLKKLEGEALRIAETLGPKPSWEATKSALISNFGVKQTYQQLFQDALAAKNDDIVSYLNYLKHILNRINEKYEYDIKKPIEFNPSNIDKLIFKIFLDNIDENLAFIIVSKGIIKLSDLFRLFERENLIMDYFEKNNYINYHDGYLDSDQYVKDCLENCLGDNSNDEGNINGIGFETDEESEELNRKKDQELSVEKLNLNSIFLNEDNYFDNSSIINSNAKEYINSFSQLNEQVCTDGRKGSDGICVDNDKFRNRIDKFGIIQSSIVIRKADKLIVKKDALNSVTFNHQTDVKFYKADNLCNRPHENYVENNMKVSQTDSKIIKDICNKLCLLGVPYLGEVTNIYIGNKKNINKIKLEEKNSYARFVEDNRNNFMYKIYNTEQNRQKPSRIYTKRKRKKIENIEFDSNMYIK